TTFRECCHFPSAKNIFYVCHIIAPYAHGRADTMARTSKSTVESTKAVGYIWVSTDKQAEQGVSLEAQHVKLTAYAQLYDLELVEVIVDAGVSAETLEREGLQRALGMLRKGQVNALLVAKLDRLTRSVKDLGALVEEYFSSDKITLLSVTDN